MNKRMRKKWLKQNGLYVSSKDTWNLGMTIAEFVLPRLKLFKKVNNGYPGIEDMDTPEKWDDALDKMIEAFTLVIEVDDLHDKYWSEDMTVFNKEIFETDQDKIDEGLHLFATWFQHLWW